jgi:hypothetical protein
MLLLEPTDGRSLASVIATSRVTALEASTPESLRFRLDTSDVPALTGATIELDTAHSDMIRRIELANGPVTEVLEYSQYGGEVWLPSQIQQSVGALTVTTRVLECQVNTDIPEDALLVDFPEGARVDEPEKNLIHIWGKGQAHESFTNRADFDAYVDAARRRAQAGPTSGRPMLAAISQSWIVGIIVAFLAFIPLLVFARKRYARR